MSEYQVPIKISDKLNFIEQTLKQAYWKIEELQKENENLKAQLDKCEGALKFYSTRENWTSCHLPGSGLGRTIIKCDGEKHNDEITNYYFGETGGCRAREYFKEKEQV